MTWRCLLSFSLVAGIGCGAPPRYSSEELTVCAKGPTIRGVDVSHYDGTIDWAAAKGAGIDFAFMKATENTDFFDPTFDTNWKNAATQGVVRGAYHFFRPATDAVQQADYFVQKAGVPQSGDLPLTLDLEATDGLSGAQVAQDALLFLARLAQVTGRVPIVYTSASFFNATLGAPKGFDPYILWDANWQVQCPNVPSPPWSDWSFWQDSDSGTVAGISSKVDLDQFNGTLADLQKFAAIAPQIDGGTDSDGSVSVVDAASSASADSASRPITDGAAVDAGALPLSPAAGCSCDLRGARPHLRGPRSLLWLALFGVILLRGGRDRRARNWMSAAVRV